jgi:hypothetical protein
MFNQSVCSYPDRGHWGNSQYRGNCTGHIIRDFIESYMRNQQGLVADPSVGGGTSEAVARELGVRFKGTDLHQGFNLLTDDFSSFLGEEAHLVWWHPPYWDMLAYSGAMWGDTPHRWDMSRMALPEFVESLELAIMNIHDACEKGGHYGILMGNMRRDGRYYNLSSLVERIAPGQLVDEIIKVQHNCTSDRRQYGGRLIRIGHEKLLVFRRGNAPALVFLMETQRRARNLISMTWKAAVRRVLQGGKVMRLDEIYEHVTPFAQQRQNNHWQAKVRQVLQDDRYFERIEPGVYRLAS